MIIKLHLCTKTTGWKSKASIWILYKYCIWMNDEWMKEWMNVIITEVQTNNTHTFYIVLLLFYKQNKGTV